MWWERTAFSLTLSLSSPSNVPSGRSMKADWFGTKTVYGPFLPRRSTMPASFSAAINVLRSSFPATLSAIVFRFGSATHDPFFLNLSKNPI